MILVPILLRVSNIEALESVNMLKTSMINIVYEIAICLLLLTAVGITSVQPKQLVYVDEVNGTLDFNCWKTESLHCGSKMASDDLELHNSTLLVTKYECKCKKLHESAADVPLDPQCPTWFIPDYSSNGTCRCGDDIHDAVKCNNSTKQVSVLDCYCMTYNKATGPVVGSCLYKCILNDDLYHLVPSDITQLNSNMCGYLNRGGQLCGKCKENYSIPVYSYEMKCVQCSTSPFNWIKYILAAFLPLTVFFVLVLSCRLSATSPKMFAFVFLSQTAAVGANVRILLAEVEPYPIAAKLTRIMATIYGIWNLDFFRTAIPHICVNVNTLQALALDYAIAFYPLILLVVAYTLIQIHTCNLRVISVVCRPLHRCTEHFRSQWDVRSSIVDSFATFLLLSYVKLLSVSFDLLIPIQVNNVKGSLVGLYLYYDATIEYFGEEHLPYAVLAVTVMLVFILFPLLLLLLYPMRCFQQCLSCIGVRWHALPIFIDAFQGCYKDGTNGTWDCRYFAAAFLFARMLLFIIFGLSQTAMFYGAALFVFIVLVMAIVIVRPYKPRFSTYNAVDSVLVLIMALWCATVVCITIAGLKAHRWQKWLLALLFIAVILPLFYILFVTLHWVCSRRQFGQRMIGRVRGWIGENHRQMVAADSEESLPDRLVNPDEYEDLTDPVAVQVEDKSN